MTTTASRDALVKLTIESYFHAVDQKRMEDALGLFHEDATFTLYPSETCHRGRDEIAGMYEGIFARHGHPSREVIDVCADPVEGLVTASFRATFPGDGSTPLILHNVNIWRVEFMQFRWVKVFTGHPGF